MYRVTNRLVAVSEPLKREIMNELGLMNVAVIPNGVNTARYVPLPRSQRESVILHMGTRPVKNLKTTVKAFDIVLKELPDVQLYITGKASIRDVMSSSVKSTKNVKFLDVMPKRELRQLLSKVVVVSAPSLYEAFSFSTLEAFASGTPVVGSSAIPAGLLINGYNGYRISHPTDYLELANRLLDLLRDNSRWNAMSQNARATAMKYDSSKMADMYLEMSKGLR
jgi:glycosyltransferase involved in cell wall biosynthesis